MIADGRPLVVSNPAGPVGAAFMNLGATVVREVAKLSTKEKHGMNWDEQQQLFRVVLPAAPGSSPSAPFFLEPAVVRRHDTSARSLNEWTGASLGAGDVADDVKPLSIALVGNYAVQITWDDGFNQVGFQTAFHVACLSVLKASCRTRRLHPSVALHSQHPDYGFRQQPSVCRWASQLAFCHTYILLLSLDDKPTCEVDQPAGCFI